MGFKIFGFNIGKNEPLTQEVEIPTGIVSQGFSTPFQKIGKGNLSLPRVDKYYTYNNIVRFNNDNLYPQLLNQMYYTSSIHGQCIDYITNSVIGGGYSFVMANLSAQEKVDLLTFEKKQKFNKMSQLLTRDFIIHRRVCVIVIRDEKGNLLRLKRIDPSEIRNNSDLTQFAQSFDWSKGTSPKMIKRYNRGSKEIETIYIYQEDTPGQSIYPIPRYNSVLNWCNLDGDIAFLQKSNIQNGVFPSLALRVPTQFRSPEQFEEFRQSIVNNTGPEDSNKLLILSGNGFDNTPEIVSLNSNQNDKLFGNTIKDMNISIARGHGIDPALVGQSLGGSLGNNQQLELLYTMFEKTIVMPNRIVMEEILNDLIDIAKIPNSIKINNYQIIDKTIVEVKTQGTNSGLEKNN